MRRLPFQISCTSDEDFCRALEEWIHLDWSRAAQDALILRLDEYEIGGVTLTSLESFVGEKTLDYAVKDFIHGFDPELYNGMFRYHAFDNSHISLV